MLIPRIIAFFRRFIIGEEKLIIWEIGPLVQRDYIDNTKHKKKYGCICDTMLFEVSICLKYRKKEKLHTISVSL